MVKTKKYLEGLIPVIVSLAILVLFLTQPLAQAQQGAAPMTTQATTGQVTPVLNTNVTWSNFNSSMTPNEYLNSTGSPHYLNGEPSIFDPNFISVNTSDIRSPALQGDNLSALGKWENLSLWTDGGGGKGTVVSKGTQGTSIYMTANTTNASASYGYLHINIPVSDLLSNNPSYNYLTVGYALYGHSLTSVTGILQSQNNTSNGVKQVSYITPNQISYQSLSLTQIAQLTGQNYTLSGSNAISTVGIQLSINFPQTNLNYTYKVMVNSMALTEYPIYLGQNATGNMTYKAIGNAQLSKFAPSIPMNITDNGYTESLSQPMGMASNYTETQVSISSGSYIEETTQQGIFSLPTAPNLSYSNSNLTLQMNGINASQITLINANGVSYSSGLSGFNGTTYALGTVNPNNPNSVIIQVEYTAAQWNSFTSAPSFFSVAGIEYYWWIFIISTLGAVGLFAGLKSYAAGKEETQRVVPPPRMR